MRHVAQSPAHYEVELRQPAPGDGRTGATWRVVSRVGPDGIMAPLRFGSLQEARIVAVEHGGWRRTVDAAEI